MPKQKPHRSEQSVGTPVEFLDAVERRFGKIRVDLAANRENAVCDEWFDVTMNSLSKNWSTCSGLLFLNPPFSNIAPWAEKCALERARGARIALLVPASVGSHWFNEHVRPHAYVFELTPRLTFVGHEHAYPKDLVLALYEPAGYVGREVWRWK